MPTETDTNVGNEGNADFGNITIGNVFSAGGTPPSQLDNKDTKANPDGEPTTPITTDTKPVETVVTDTKADPAEEEIVEEYSQNTAGDLLDKDGKVVAKKGEYEVDAEGTISFTGKEDNLSPVLNIAKEKGYDLVDEDGNPMEFENTPDGVFALATTIGERMIDEYETKLLTTFPIVEEIVNHLKAGKSPEDFFKSKVETTDYTKMTFSKDDVGTQRNLIRNYYTNVGNLTAEDAEEAIKLFEDSGKLEEKSKSALERLKQHQITTENARKAANQEAIRVKEANTAQYWDGVKQTINTGNLGDITIPEKDKNDFLKFIAVPNKDGVVGVSKKYNELPTDKKLMIDYLLYKDLSLEDLVSLKVNQKQVNDLRKRKAVLTPTAGSRKVIKSSGAEGGDYTLGNLA
jgi:uncharacterized protein (DUF433 family)